MKYCQICGIKIWGTQRKYCLKCKKEIHLTQMKKYYRMNKNDKIKLLCHQCGNEYEIYSSLKDKSKFCSKKCKGIWESKNLIGSNHPNYGRSTKLIKICEVCSEEFKVTPSHETQRFCNQKCMGKWKSENLRGENSYAWKGGISNQPYCHLFNNSFKEIIRNRFHNKCYLCNKSKKNNSNRKLSVHHVNYNKNCLCGSACEFVPLCMKCHSKTNHNRQYYEDLIMCYLYPERYFMGDL